MTCFRYFYLNIYILKVLLLFNIDFVGSVPVETVCSKFSYDEQLLEKMVRMEFFVENMKKNVDNSVSNVLDVMNDVKGNNSELAIRVLEQQGKIVDMERQAGVLDDTKANKNNVLENTKNLESMKQMMETIKKDLEENISDLRSNSDLLSEQQVNLERTIGVFNNTMANKSNVSDSLGNFMDIESVTENIMKDMMESFSSINNLQNFTNDIVNECKEGLSNLSTQFADIEKQLEYLHRSIEENQAVAFNVMDAGPFSGSDAVTFNDILVNEGNAFNKATGMFIAPVDGIYIFSAHICVQKGSDKDYFIKVNDISIVTGEFIVPNISQDGKCVSFSAVAIVRKGEHVRVGGMSSRDITESTNDLCSFSGSLIQRI